MTTKVVTVSGMVWGKMVVPVMIEAVQILYAVAAQGCCILSGWEG